MQIVMLAAVLITLPAIVVVIAFFGSSMVFPALASLGINSLPFILAILLMRKNKGKQEDFGH